MTKKITGIALLGLVLLTAACGGGGSSGGTGSVGDRADLSGAAGSNTTRGSTGASSSATTLIVQGLEAVKDTATTTTEDCLGGGTMTVTIDTTTGSLTGSTIPITLDMDATAASCGEDQYTGTMTMDGTMNVQISGENVTIDGTFNMDFSGSTTACTSITGDLTAGLDFSGSSGTLTIDGTVTGTCAEGSATCTFDNVQLSTSDTEAQMKEKMCDACDVPTESCS